MLLCPRCVGGLKITISFHYHRYHISENTSTYRILQTNEFSVPWKPLEQIWLRLALKSAPELFECECNIVNGTLLSRRYCRASMVLFLGPILGTRADWFECELPRREGKRNSLSFSYLPFSERTKRSEVAELACRTRWACKPCSRLGTLYKRSRTCRTAATRIPSAQAIATLSLIHRCDVIDIILSQSEVANWIELRIMRNVFSMNFALGIKMSCANFGTNCMIIWLLQ